MKIIILVCLLIVCVSSINIRYIREQRALYAQSQEKLQKSGVSIMREETKKCYVEHEEEIIQIRTGIMDTLIKTKAEKVRVELSTLPIACIAYILEELLVGGVIFDYNVDQAVTIDINWTQINKVSMIYITDTIHPLSLSGQYECIMFNHLSLTPTPENTIAVFFEKTSKLLENKK
jgi:hypothetical protein